MTDQGSTAEVAAKAREFLSGPSRWRHGDGYSGPAGNPSRVCLGNALVLARHGMLYTERNANPIWTVDLDVAAEIIREQFPERVLREGVTSAAPSIVGRFNDHHDTTCGDVQLILEKMAAG